MSVKSTTPSPCLKKRRSVWPITFLRKRICLITWHLSSRNLPYKRLTSRSCKCRNLKSCRPITNFNLTWVILTPMCQLVKIMPSFWSRSRTVSTITIWLPQYLQHLRVRSAKQSKSSTKVMKTCSQPIRAKHPSLMWSQPKLYLLRRT